MSDAIISSNSEKNELVGSIEQQDQYDEVTESDLETTTQVYPLRW